MTEIMNLTLEEKIGQMIGAGFDGLTPPDHLLEWLAQGRIGAVLLFGRNVRTPAQLATLTEVCHAASKYPLLIAIDQEGGMVTRLREGYTVSPGAMALAAAGDEALAYEMAHVMATELRALGINWNFAPVVDLVYDIRNRSVGTRSLGNDPALVSRIAAAQIRGFQTAGVAACAKHFPGIGRTPIDTHEAFASIPSSADELENDLVPYRTAIREDVATVMVSHVQFPALDATYPATLSPRIIGALLRDTLDFSGVTCTDDMEMKAIADHYGQGEAAVLAALAGEDMILISHSREAQQEAYDALLNAAQSGRLPIATIDTAVERILALKARYPVGPQPPLSVIDSEAQRTVAQRAAEAGLVLLKREADLLPLKLSPAQRLVLVEFTTYMESDGIEQTGQSTLAAYFREAFPSATTLKLYPDEIEAEDAAAVQAEAQTADVLVVATRNAHLLPEQLAQTKALLALGKPTVLLCLRNPYDADILSGADVVLCTCGDNGPSLAAVVAALAGRVTPTGTLPVSTSET
jgi:beta-N-acetylhexosaminidase